MPLVTRRPFASVAAFFGGRIGAWLAFASLAIVLGIVALAAWMSLDSRRTVWKNAVQTAENIDALLEHDIRRNIESYDLSLQAVVDGMKVEGIRTMPPDIRDMILFDRATTAQYLGSINVLDETGAIVIDSTSPEPRRGNFGDRDYFTAQRDRRDLGLFISRPFFSRLDNEMEIGLSRRLEHSDGSFAGVVVGTMQLEFFSQLFETVDLGPDGNITLINTDGRIIMRKPFDVAELGRQATFRQLFSLYTTQSAGYFEATARRDGLPRLFAYHQVGSYPLLLSVGASVPAIFAEWWQKTATIALGVTILMALAAAFGGLCLVELRRRSLAEAAARENERRYRLLAENSTDMIVRASLEGVRRYVSPACRSLYGYEPEELIGTRASDFIHPDDLAHMPIATARLLAGEDKVVSSYRARRKDGSYVWVEASRKLVADPEAEAEFVIVVRDVQARQEIEAELEAARNRAEAANEAKSRFLANMSHELRTPLNAVIGFSDLMARQAFGPLGDDKYRIYASDIRASGQHLLELINEVLDHAKAESGHLDLREEVVPIGALIDFAVRMLTPRAEYAGIEIRSSVAGGLHAVRGDDRRLKQVLLNLITNAIKFTPSGGEVAVSAAVAAGGELTISVKDTGIGIPANEQAKIFEPFMQAGPAKEGPNEGTGLGLPLTKRLVELHGGRLELSSTVGIGTTIVVRLPAGRLVAAPATQTAAASAVPTVLVVDDDAPVLHTAVTLLKRMGFTTLVAGNANEALAQLQRGGRIDLLFTGIVMPPGMNGVELAGQARKLQPGIKILLTSGFTGPATAHGSDLGGHRMIEKPYGFADLKAAIESVLGRSSTVIPLTPLRSAE